MAVTISIIISVLALLTTFYQLHLQRINNEKSVKPLVQIDLPDRKNQIAVHIRNNGLGPLTVDRLIFTKNGKIYSSIADCLDLDPRTYMHISVSGSAKRVILPNTHIAVFEKNFGDHANEAVRDSIRQQLSMIKLKVEGRDIYDNKTILERDLQWFSRYCLQDGL